MKSKKFTENQNAIQNAINLANNVADGLSEAEYILKSKLGFINTKYEGNKKYEVFGAWLRRHLQTLAPLCHKDLCQKRLVGKVNWKLVAINLSATYNKSTNTIKQSCHNQL